MKDVFIYQIVRVPTAKKGGKYRVIPAELLLTHLLNQVKGKLDSKIGELQIAHSIGMMGNPARFALLDSILPHDIVATTIDAQCGGAYKSLEIAFSSIRSGQRSWFLAGGMESSSLQSQRNYNTKDPRYSVNMVQIETAEFAPFKTLTLNESAKKLANDYDVSKVEMLHWTARSHQLAEQFHKTGKNLEFVIPYNGLAKDQGIKEDLSFEKLTKLTTSELIDRTTACSFFDGAGIILLGDADFGKSNGLKPKARIEAIEFVACHPNDSPKGCILASESLLKKEGLNPEDVDFYEVCESYAVKPLAFAKHFNLNHDRLNVLGSNLAMGHPFAASGVMNSLNLINCLEQNQGDRGLVCAGIAGGLGAAILINRI